MRSKFAKLPESLRMFMKLGEMYDVDTDFVATTINTDIAGIDRCNLCGLEVLAECVNNPWYYFREVIGLSEFTDIDILHAALILKGWTVVRHGEVPVDKSILPLLIHYILRFQPTERNVGMFINDYAAQQQFVKAMEAIYSVCIDDADTLEHIVSYVTNVQTGRLCRVQPAIWALATGRYSLGVFNIGDDTPFYLEKPILQNYEPTGYDTEIAVIGINGINTNKLPYEGLMSYYGDKNTVASETFVKLFESLDTKQRKYVYDLGDIYRLLNQRPDENIICVI